MAKIAGNKCWPVPNIVNREKNDLSRIILIINHDLIESFPEQV